MSFLPAALSHYGKSQLATLKWFEIITGQKLYWHTMKHYMAKQILIKWRCKRCNPQMTTESLRCCWFFPMASKSHGHIAYIKITWPCVKMYHLRNMQYLFTDIYVYIHTYLFINYLSKCLFIYIYIVFVFVYVSIFVFIHWYIHVFIYLFIYIWFHLSVFIIMYLWKSIEIFIDLYIYFLFIYISIYWFKYHLYILLFHSLCIYSSI